MANDEQPTNPRFVNLLALTGTTLRDFELGDILGQGGFGVVDEARRGGVTYALKLPLLDHSDERRRAQAVAELPRTRNEAATLQSLRHPNIVELAEYFTWDPLKGSIGDANGLPVLVMRHVDGVSVDRWVRQQHPTLRKILTAYRQVLSALECSHAHSFFHRDLKPSNILVTAEGKAMVIDFGIAKSRALKTMTEVATWIGTTDFLAPEYLKSPISVAPNKVAEHFNFTPAQDLYALGHTIFLTLTGASAWAAWKSVLSTQPSIAFAAIAQRVDLPLPSALNPLVPSDVDAFVGKLMARELSIRFSAASTAIKVLDAILSKPAPELDAAFALPSAEECDRRVEEYSQSFADSLDEEEADAPEAVDVSLSSLVAGSGLSQTHVRPQQQPTVSSPKPPAASTAKQTVPLRGLSRAESAPAAAPTASRQPAPSSASVSVPSEKSASASTSAKRPSNKSRPQAAPAASETPPSRRDPSSPATAGFQAPSVISAPAFEDVAPVASPPVETPAEVPALSPELERLRDEFRDYERPSQGRSRSTTMLVAGAAVVIVAVLVVGALSARPTTSSQTPTSLLEHATDAGEAVAAEAVYRPAPVEPSAAPVLAPPPASPAAVAVVPPPAADSKPKPRGSVDAKAVDDILRREYGGQRPTIAPDGTTSAPSPAPAAPVAVAPAGWGTRGVYTQPAAAPAGPRRFGVGIGSELSGLLLKPLDSRIGVLPVVCKLKRAWAPRGEVLLPTGTMFFGQASSSSGRFTVAFNRLKLPDGVEAPLQALAYDVTDKKPGLSPSRRIQTQAAGGPNVGEAVARGAANVALGQVQGGPLADVARGAGQTVVNQQGSAGSAAQEALLLDAPVDVTIFITEAF
jgi:serine/threonine protein kinase